MLKRKALILFILMIVIPQTKDHFSIKYDSAQPVTAVWIEIQQMCEIFKKYTQDTHHQNAQNYTHSTTNT